MRCAGCDDALPTYLIVELEGKPYHPRSCFAGALAAHVQALIVARVGAAVAEHQQHIFARLGDVVKAGAIGGAS